MKVQDHHVSKTWYALKRNAEHGYLMTCPKPLDEDLLNYYPENNYLSHQAVPYSFLEKFYHLMRSLAMIPKKIIVKRLKINNKRLLDVGCGTGFFLKSMKKLGWQVFGVEPNKAARLAANRLTENAVFDNEQAFEWENSSFDLITLWHVLEHLPNLEKALKNLYRLLDDQGRLIVAVPNHLSYDAKYYNSYWAAYDVPRHLWHFSKDSIVSLLSTHEFELVRTYPMWLDAYYVSLLSETYKEAHLKWLKAIWFGSISNIKAMFTGEWSSRVYVFKKFNT